MTNFAIFLGVQSKRFENHPVHQVGQDLHHRPKGVEVVVDVDRQKSDVVSLLLLVVPELEAVHYHRGVVSWKIYFTINCHENIFFVEKPDDFEIHKTENSIQKKRQYRTNKDSSQSESPDRQPANKSRDSGANRRGNQIRRSNSRSRVRGNRSRSRNRSRTPRQRSRSTRRDNNWER